MLPVEIMHTQGTVILRARSSELLILPNHVRELKGLSEARDFSEYFTREALVNRPARKLFEAWLRKDRTLWPRLFKVIHRDIDIKDVAAAEEALEQNLAGKAVEAAVSKPVTEKPSAKLAAAPKAVEAKPQGEEAKPKKAVAAKTAKAGKVEAATPDAKAKKPAAAKKATVKKAVVAEPAKKAVKKPVASKVAKATKATKSKKGS